MQNEIAYSRPVTLTNILRFAVPTIAMSVFMSFYTMVDGLFVSNLIGTSALSALNLVYPVIALVTATAPPPTAARAPTPMAPYRKWRRVRRISPPLGLGMRTPEGALPRKEGAGALSRRPALRRAGATWRLDGAGRCEEGVPRRLARRWAVALGRACVGRFATMMFIVSFPAQVKAGLWAIVTITANTAPAHGIMVAPCADRRGSRESLRA